MDEMIENVIWLNIDDAPLGVWGLAWAPGWRRPFPAMRNGNNGAVWVDTCELSATGRQEYARFWRAMPDLPTE